MSEAPKDPFAFSFGVDFESSGDRVRNEREERKAMTARRLQYHHAFLDDLLRAILPHDLILLGAETGAGKTEMAIGIAKANARNRKRVAYFALEAEKLEVERRIKYSIIAEFATRDRVPGAELMTYTDWYLGNCESIAGKYDETAENAIRLEYGGLRTYYRGSKFDHDDIRRLFLAVQDAVDLIILDHIHYVDIDDPDENRGFKRTIKMIRDVALGMGKPVIVIAHLKKRDTRSRQIVPDAEMFHGSSDIIKICTHIVMLAPARGVPVPPGVSGTFVHVPKDRMGGATGLIALCHFDRRFKAYSDYYQLGRASIDGTEFEPMSLADTPRWAKRARTLMAPRKDMPNGPAR